MDNESLAIIAKSGEDTALLALYTNNKGIIVRAARRFARVQEDYEDLLQIAIFAVMDAVNAFDGKYRFTTYLKWTLHHQFYKFITEQYRFSSAALIEEIEDGLVYQDDESAVASSMLIQILDCMKQTLSKKNYAIMLEHLCLGKNFAEIGRDLGIGRERVRMREVRSIKKLRENEDLKKIAAEYFWKE